MEHYFEINQDFKIHYGLYNNPICGNNLIFIILEYNNVKYNLYIEDGCGYYRGIWLLPNELINICKVAFNYNQFSLEEKYMFLLVLLKSSSIKLNQNMLDIFSLPVNLILPWDKELDRKFKIDNKGYNSINWERFNIAGKMCYMVNDPYVKNGELETIRDVKNINTEIIKDLIKII